MTKIKKELCSFKAEISYMHIVFDEMKRRPELIEGVWETYSGEFATLSKGNFLAAILMDSKSLSEGPFVYITAPDQVSGESRWIIGRFNSPKVREWCERQLDAYENGVWPIPSEITTE